MNNPIEPPVNWNNDPFAFLTQYTNHLDLCKKARHAIEAGDLYHLKTLMPEFKWEHLNQLIVEAAGANQLEIMCYLLDRNNHPYVQDINYPVSDIHYENESAAKCAAQHGNLDLLKYIIENYDININAPGKIKQLDKMSMSGSMLGVYFMLDVLPEEQYDVLLYALKHNQVKIVDYLLHAPQTKDKVKMDYAHAFNTCARYGATDAFNYLLNIAPSDTVYDYIFMMSVGSQSYDISKIILEKNLVNINTCIKKTVKSMDELDTTGTFLSPATLNKMFNFQPQNYYYTALSIACMYSDKSMVDYFISNGASLPAHHYVILSNKLNLEMMQHLIINHNLDNNEPVQLLLQKHYNGDEHQEIIKLFNARDLAQMLQKELPQTSFKPSRRKI